MNPRPVPAGKPDRHPRDDPARLSRVVGMGAPDARRQPAGKVSADRLFEPGAQRSEDEAALPDPGRTRDDREDPGDSPRGGPVAGSGAPAGASVSGPPDQVPGQRARVAGRRPGPFSRQSRRSTSAAESLAADWFVAGFLTSCRAMKPWKT